ncbi:NUDIX hydrolase [Candidatus Bathyarchaeota archaeon]|nr:NUDIX hydrolase [Candidatus Bathyarchaeota archaeon]
MENMKKRSFTGRTAAAIIIKEPSLILLVKRLTIPFLGYWALPGGRQEPGETIEQTIIREVKEETGFEVKIIKKIGEYREKGIKDNVKYDYSPACFLTEIIGGDIEISGNEISSIKFFPLETIPENLAFEHLQMIKDYIKSL